MCHRSAQAVHWLRGDANRPSTWRRPRMFCPDNSSCSSGRTIDMRSITQQMPQSPFRFPGGKARVANYLRIYRPLDAIELREPFAGGGSFAIENGFAFDHVWINDLTTGLVA